MLKRLSETVNGLRRRTGSRERLFGISRATMAGPSS
jgi:hypothetical protein